MTDAERAEKAIELLEDFIKKVSALRKCCLEEELGFALDKPVWDVEDELEELKKGFDPAKEEILELTKPDPDAMM